MTLPIIFDIAVGLMFVYLMLSLVASEVQEILTALFQWRAEHLKRSIEQLLAGEGWVGQAKAGRAQQSNAARQLADELYDAPLIESLNYEARGPIARSLRAVLHGIGAVYRLLTFSRNVFGRKNSGPSYIPAETFATSLIDRLKLADFQQLLVRSRFETFLHTDVRLPLHNMVNELRARLENEELMAAELLYFDQGLDHTAAELAAGRVSLETALASTVRQIQDFEAMASDTPLEALGVSPALVETFLGRLRYLRSSLQDDPSADRRVLARLRPTLPEVIDLLDPKSSAYHELVALSRKEGEAIQTALEKVSNTVIPAQLRANLQTLAQRAELKASAVGTDLSQFQGEVEAWFNRGMDRASGVYRRNVKGVGLLVGLAIAFAINADTFYMFNQLSSAPAIRQSILESAEQLDIATAQSPADIAERSGVDDSLDARSVQLEDGFRSVGTALEETLADYPLPIGRNPKILADQAAAEDRWILPIVPQRFLGWLITGLALSMGSSFWFDLLRKVTSVRASGNPPASSTTSSQAASE